MLSMVARPKEVEVESMLLEVAGAADLELAVCMFAQSFSLVEETASIAWCILSSSDILVLEDDTHRRDQNTSQRLFSRCFNLTSVMTSEASARYRGAEGSDSACL